MRDKLRNFEEYFWGLSKSDLKTTSDLVRLFITAYWKNTPLPKATPITPEIDLFISQHYRETQFLIQFGIWRLQSVFESLLKTNFNIKNTSGIWKIIEALKIKGFRVIKETELLEWTTLRNKLSHSAPEMTHPCPTNLLVEDIDDFERLLLEIFEDLENQKNNASRQ